MSPKRDALSSPVRMSKLAAAEKQASDNMAVLLSPELAKRVFGFLGPSGLCAVMTTCVYLNQVNVLFVIF